MLPTEEFSPVLGDTFLRSAYVVYHLGNDQISLAPTVFNATGSDIREINNGTDGVPDATLVPGAIETGAGLGGGARNDGTPGFNEDFEIDVDDSDNGSSSSDDEDTVSSDGAGDDDSDEAASDSAATRSAGVVGTLLMVFAVVVNAGMVYAL